MRYTAMTVKDQPSNYSFACLSHDHVTLKSRFAKVWLVCILAVATRVHGFAIPRYPASQPNGCRYHPRLSLLFLQNERIDHGDRSAVNDDAVLDASNDSSRRTILASLATTILSAATALPWPIKPADAESLLAPPPTSLILPDQAVVTDKIFINVRISRSDGTFYVRDDLPDVVENQVFTGRLVIGLFGKNAPNHVARFLSYVAVDAKPLEESPLPSYSRSSFTQLDQATGILYGGTIPSLEVTELQGMSALKYGGRLFPSKLWLESSTASKLSHVGVGLLTHEAFDVTPVFGVTTRSDTTSLDRSHTVFGKLLLDDTSTAFLKRVSELPTYSVDRRVVSTDNDGNGNNPVLEEAERAIFAAQRDFFRGAAKSLGDTRVNKLYEGKLLRRVEVTQVGLL